MDGTDESEGLLLDASQNWVLRVDLRVLEDFKGSDRRQKASDSKRRSPDPNVTSARMLGSLPNS